MALATVALAAMLGLPACAPASPAAPSGLRVAPSSAGLSITWNPRPGASRYDIRFRRPAGGAWRVTRRPARVRRLVLASAAPYVFQVRACARRRCSPWSAPVTAAPGPGAPGSAPTSATELPTIGGCPVLPADNPFNRDVSHAPLDPRSSRYIASIGRGGHLHPDFGSNPDYGIPYSVVPASQPALTIRFTAYGAESDPGPYPIPLRAPIESGSDRHVLVVQSGTCKLYELFAAKRAGGLLWEADSGATFDLGSDALRPDGWTSADAAGLPILPGLVRYDEVRAGAVRHAIRMTVEQTQRAFIHPATHFASSSTDPSRPPMGLRLRLKASFDITRFPRASRIILQAMKTYGLIVADNGTNWFFGGATDSRWNDDELNPMKTVPGRAFEVVRSGSLQRG
ncbi:MAG TPA: fibronectin type III domain-containing protein [Solirubrobacteraceae bacterium]|nr:fibronectin type III domain-containing protein [Solirubrobacteraceae bacterium]